MQLDLILRRERHRLGVREANGRWRWHGGVREVHQPALSQPNQGQQRQSAPRRDQEHAHGARHSNALAASQQWRSRRCADISRTLRMRFSPIPGRARDAACNLMFDTGQLRPPTARAGAARRRSRPAPQAPSGRRVRCRYPIVRERQPRADSQCGMARAGGPAVCVSRRSAWPPPSPAILPRIAPWESSRHLSSDSPRAPRPRSHSPHSAGRRSRVRRGAGHRRAHGGPRLLPASPIVLGQSVERHDRRGRFPVFPELGCDRAMSAVRSQGPDGGHPRRDAHVIRPVARGLQL